MKTNNTSTKSGNTIFHAKVKVGEGENAAWEFRGTVVIRANGKGGVLYLKTNRKNEDGSDIYEEIALFQKRETTPSAAQVAVATAQS